jgi:hypothetical protein
MHEASLPTSDRNEQEQGSRIGGAAPATGSQTIEKFVVARQNQQAIGDLIESNLGLGRVTEKATLREYLNWRASTGKVSGLVRRPNYFYWVEKL